MSRRFVIICGHYGCGKTNFALNYALNSAKKGERVTLADLDIVNPYFCSVDHREELIEKGINFIAPTFAGTNLDLPSISAQIYSVFDMDGTVILDVGGDDAGATVLGRFNEYLKNIDYEMFYVINMYRNLTPTSREAAEILREIEIASRCKATAIVNNSHLKQETTKETVLSSMDYARKTAQELRLPLKYVTVPNKIYSDSEASFAELKDVIYPVEVIVKTPWE